MKIKIITVGTPALNFVKEGVKEYQKRLTAFADVELVHIKEDKSFEKKILKAIEKTYPIFLDERGKEYTSNNFAAFLEKTLIAETVVSFVIGGPNGHSPELILHARAKLALSQQTFPHDIALLLLAEALYRSFTILNKHPYHRD